jgi:superfamily II DNA or RNA helicase
MINELWDTVLNIRERSINKIGSTNYIEWRKFGDGQTMNPYPLKYKWYLKIISLGQFNSLIQMEKTIHIYPFFKQRHYYVKGGGTEFFSLSNEDSSLQKVCDILTEYNVKFEVYTEDIFIKRPLINEYKKYLDEDIFKIEYEKVEPLPVKSKYEKTENIVLRDYQVSAINTMLKNNKGILILPTGVGKTIIFLYYLEKYKKDKMNLILVPSKKLVEQTEKVAKKLNFNITLCYSDKIFKPINDKNILIISTYQSSYKVINNTFDTIIFDECHTTVINNQIERVDISDFQKMLIEGKSKEKFFFTATEKTISLDSLDKNEVIFTMDNEEQYGNIIFKYRLDEAIIDGYLCDYNLDMIVTTDKNTSLVHHINKKKGLRIFIYCSSIKKSGKLSLFLKKYFPDGYISSLSSENNRKEQEECLYKFKNHNGISIICLCKLFIVGFDEPSIDMIIHYDKCQSVIELTQKNGRALRLYPSGKIKATIVFMIENDKPEDLRYYKKVMRKLILEDARLEANLKKLSEKSKVYKSINLITYIPDIKDNNEISTIYDRYVNNLCPTSNRKEEFIKLRIYVRKLKLQDKTKYSILIKNDPVLIYNPDDYFGQFWTNWYDFLGLPSNTFPQTKEKWVNLCKKLSIRSWSHYKEIQKTRDDLPLMPGTLYPNYTNFNKELKLKKLIINRSQR